MGASNALAAYALYAEAVPATSMQILVYMCLVSRDTDESPWFGLGYAALAQFALGRPSPILEKDLRAVERAVGPLLKAGAISTDRRAAPRRDGPHTARYRLHLIKPVDPRKTWGDIACGKPGDDPRKTERRPTKNGETTHENRGSEDVGGTTRSEKNTGGILRPQLTTACATPENFPTGCGFCGQCYADGSTVVAAQDDLCPYHLAAARRPTPPDVSQTADGPLS